MSEREDVDRETSATDNDVTVGPLPELVRARVVTLAAEALGRMPVDNLPAALKRVASFAPGRRAKLAGNQIASVLESDDSFREQMARQIRDEFPEIADALRAGVRPAAAHPVDVAAVAYLLRPHGWAEVVRESSGVVLAERAGEASRQSQGQVDRLRRQLETATEELKAARQRHRDEVAKLKQENSELRHKLGDARARAREAVDAGERAGRDIAEARQAANAATASADAELRRLRSRIDDLESEVANLRRAGRAERDTGTLRARLLLDTLIDSAQGLRRELALPAVQGTPADAVEADEGEHGHRRPSGHGSLSTDDPAVLEHLLALPRAHLIVDGYNVTKTAYPDLSLERQRERLLAGLAPLGARTRAEITVVFDAAESKDRPLVSPPRGVRVRFSPRGVIADDVIRQYVAAEPAGRPVVVVTSDQAVARDTQRAGFRAVGSAALARLLAGA